MGHLHTHFGCKSLDACFAIPGVDVGSGVAVLPVGAMPTEKSVSTLQEDATSLVQVMC